MTGVYECKKSRIRLRPEAAARLASAPTNIQRPTSKGKRKSEPRYLGSYRGEIIFDKTNPIFAKNNSVATGFNHECCRDRALQKCRFSLHKTNPILWEKPKAEG
jgi:hypothetical protein